MVEQPEQPAAQPNDDPLSWLELERDHPGGSRVAFQRQLADCDAQLVHVATMVSDRVVAVTEAFLQADAHRAQETIAADAEIDRRCRRLEEACFVLLARQAPVARDLRRIVAVLRSSADVERSGDLLRHVAESLAWVHPPSMSSDLQEMIGQLGTVSGEVFADAIDAWRHHDPLAAVDLQRRDDQVDLLQKSLLTELYTGHQTVEEAVSLALICRYYERIADHGVEMAREVTYYLTGERPTEE